MGKGKYDEIGGGHDPRDLATFTVLVVVTQVIIHFIELIKTNLLKLT
jgi:hypothetical protein